MTQYDTGDSLYVDGTVLITAWLAYHPEYAWGWSCSDEYCYDGGCDFLTAEDAAENAREHLFDRHGATSTTDICKF